MQAIFFHNFSPVAFTILGFDVYWYSLAYVVGIILGMMMLRYLNKKDHVFNESSLEDLIVYCIIGILVGGRLGYMLFYDFNDFVNNPAKIFRIRDGGMSFHGGMIGVVVMIKLVTMRNKVKFLRAMDIVACASPIGLCLGRIANFINAEMYGVVTKLPWGVVFPHAGRLPRHPTQLYEAFFEGIVLFVILMLNFNKYHKQSGKLCGIFLIWYAIFRFGVEYLKVADDGHIWILTTGQFLSIPMFILGLFLFARHTKH